MSSQIWCCVSSNSTSQVSLVLHSNHIDIDASKRPWNLNEQCRHSRSTHHLKHRPPTTNISNFRKDPHHSTSRLWSFHQACHWLLLPAPNPPTFVFLWLVIWARAQWNCACSTARAEHRDPKPPRTGGAALESAPNYLQGCRTHALDRLR